MQETLITQFINGPKVKYLIIFCSRRNQRFQFISDLFQANALLKLRRTDNNENELKVDTNIRRARFRCNGHNHLPDECFCKQSQCNKCEKVGHIACRYRFACDVTGNTRT